jgi:2-polyprenyl-6-methoxyphenol hydroxylase-like FAD-dependent oxidoreductase
MAEHSAKLGKHAIVNGSSMGGLLAARALADHFEQVTLLERDTFPAPGENRKGVPQGKHTHILLELGRKSMETCLPGLTDELIQLGAVAIGDASLNVRWFSNGGYHQPGASGLSAVGVSRPTLEALVRARVLALPNVRAVEGCDVLGLMTTADKGRVTGVRMVRREGAGGEETATADLVVDASGRGSRSPAWLEKLGYERPEVEETRIGVGYTSCYYRRQPEHIPGLHSIVVMATPPNKRGGVLMAQEGNRWVVSMGGYLGDHAPTDHDGFLEFVRGLPTPAIYDVIKEAEPLGEPVSYKFPANLRHRYEKLTRFPEGYLVLADALCSFNPIYGQGMTVAAQEAVTLGECLANDRGELAKRFFVRASKIVDVPWGAVVGNDLRFPEVEGRRTPMVRFINWYLGKLHIAAQMDARVSIAFLKVINMVASPPSVMHPGIAWRVLKGNVRGQRAGSVPQYRVGGEEQYHARTEEASGVPHR